MEKIIGRGLEFVIIGLVCAACTLGGDPGKYDTPILIQKECITGTPCVGMKLEIDTDSLDWGVDIVSHLSYQWMRNGTTYLSSDPVYTVHFADIGSTITVTLQRSNSSETVTGVPVGPVPQPSVSIEGSTSGNASTGQQLTVKTSNLGAVSYEWERNSKTGSIGTGSTYTVRNDDGGSLITVTARVLGDPGHVTSGQIKTSPYVSEKGISMVWIPAGTFLMGSSEDDPDHQTDETQHDVSLSNGFYMGIYPVTQGQWVTVVGENWSEFTTDASEGEVQGNRPAESIIWYYAIEFCNALSLRESLTPYYNLDTNYYSDPYNDSDVDDFKMLVTKNETANGYRLPTEAQWEYACRAGTSTTYNFGNDVSQLGDYAWYQGNSGSKTHEVGLKIPNAWGLYDMLGNVLEMCWDWWSPITYLNGAQTDPQGSPIGGYRITRGGSWSDPAGENFRSAERFVVSPNYYSSDIGFRVVRPDIFDQ
ncbi:MAG: formylglycine-generating enzyme family protein [Treponema sp.]|nr:formylglycine-generating enzyme family protein [Treponema sp.]